MSYLSVAMIKYLGWKMPGNSGVVLDYSYRKHAVHCVKKDMTLGSPAGSDVESSYFTYIQGAEMKTKHEARQ